MAKTLRLHRRDARVVDLHPAGWPGRYRLAGDSHQPWTRCRIVHVAPLGAGVDLVGEIELLGPSPTIRQAERLLVELTAQSGEMGSVQLHGEIRSITTGDDGDIHVGVAFTDLTMLEHHALEMMLDASDRGSKPEQNRGV